MDKLHWSCTFAWTYKWVWNFIFVFQTNPTHFTRFVDVCSWACHRLIKRASQACSRSLVTILFKSEIDFICNRLEVMHCCLWCYALMKLVYSGGTLSHIPITPQSIKSCLSCVLHVRLDWVYHWVVSSSQRSARFIKSCFELQTPRLKTLSKVRHARIQINIAP